MKKFLQSIINHCSINTDKNEEMFFNAVTDFAENKYQTRIDLLEELLYVAQSVIEKWK